MSQCKQIISLCATDQDTAKFNSDADFGLCDEEGFFTLFCVLEEDHPGRHETSPIHWKSQP